MLSTKVIKALIEIAKDERAAYFKYRAISNFFRDVNENALSIIFLGMSNDEGRHYGYVRTLIPIEHRHEIRGKDFMPGVKSYNDVRRILLESEIDENKDNVKYFNISGRVTTQSVKDHFMGMSNDEGNHAAIINNYLKTH